MTIVTLNVTLKIMAETMEIVLMSFAARAVTSAGLMITDDVMKTAFNEDVNGMEWIVMSMFAMKNVCIIVDGDDYCDIECYIEDYG